MKEIKLTQNKVALVDDENFEYLNQFKWYTARNGRTWYARRHASRINGKQKLIQMHRIIINAPKHLQVDHVNGDGLDNRKENLRLCTHQENHFNIKNTHKNNKLRTKGITWHKTIKKFRAQIMINKKAIHLGYFNVMGDADSAYRIAEEKYFGKFARKYLNTVSPRIKSKDLDCTESKS